MDKFKKYLQDNKAKLDWQEPEPAIWEQIENRIVPPKHQFRSIVLLKRLAAACVILLAGLGVYLLSRSFNSGVETQAQAGQAATLKQNDHNVVIDTQSTTEQPTAVNASQSDTGVLSGSVNTPNATRTGSKPFHLEAGKSSINLEEAITDVVSVLENQKTVISSTPVFGVGQEHFEHLIHEYRKAEQEEQDFKQKLTGAITSMKQVDNLIQLLQKKILLLQQLKIEMDSINNLNKHKSFEKTYVNIL